MRSSSIPDFDERYEGLLRSWCDSLIALQVRGYGAPNDGGFLCKACTMLHGRADNAVFPLMYMYAKSREQKYYDAAMAAFRFQARLRQPDGSVINDGNMIWKGITVFSALNLWKTLHYFGAALRPADRAELETAFLRLGGWVYDVIDTRFETNINYYAAAAECMCHLADYIGTDLYRTRARELLDYCMARFHEDGLFHGEIVPHDSRSSRGCYAVDMGYNLEETLLGLTETALALGEEGTVRALACHAVKMLDFLLPDGGVNNTFGCRNNKWTYYGSRTSDGCLRAFLLLSRFEPVLYEAACRNADMLRRCTSRGELYGGLHYARLGQPPCVHHTFCHAAGLADALLALSQARRERMPLPYEREESFARYYPEIATWQLGMGNMLTTVTANDFRGYTYAGGAAHASGGAISMLYHRELGPVLAGSVYGYGLTEMTNMQVPVERERAHRSLLPRWEYSRDGKTYTTCIAPDADMAVEKGENSIRVTVWVSFVEAGEWRREDDDMAALFQYELLPDGLRIETGVTKPKEGLAFILPVAENTMRLETSAPIAAQEKVFHLSGGLGADEYRFTETSLALRLY